MKYRGEESIGLVETIGLLPALKAADEILKAANVELISYENIGSTLVTIMIKGDVAAFHSAVEAGIAAVEKMNAEVYSSVVIASPHADLNKLIERYQLVNLLPKEEGGAL